MESIIARALEYTLKYWLKSFSRDQFKLQGRTAQLSNLDLNGDALHASVGLPPALNVTTAKVGKLEIIVSTLSYFGLHFIILNYQYIFDILSHFFYYYGVLGWLIANTAPENSFEQSLNLLNMMAVTPGDNLLPSENDDYYIFFYLHEEQWLCLSVWAIPDDFIFFWLWSISNDNTRRARGGRGLLFIEEQLVFHFSKEISLTALFTRSNGRMEMEIDFHKTSKYCFLLSQARLRALLRFMTGLYVCLNRGDVNPNAQQHSSEAAGRSLVSFVVDHIFLCIKDTDFQLELLMQSLFFSRASLSDGENAKFLSTVMIGGLDTFSHPPCTLVQPPMQATLENMLPIPDFGKNFLPPIYPLGEQQWQFGGSIPLISLHSLQLKPNPSPPVFASQTVIHCQPLMIHLQEVSCLRIASLIADGIVVNPGAVLPDFSVGSLMFNLKGLDIAVPLDIGNQTYNDIENTTSCQSSFSGTRLLIEDLFFSESPSLKLRLLNLEKDPACFCLWEGQPIDASQKKWTAGASVISLSLETGNDSTGVQSSFSRSSDLWRCVELKGACLEVAMATADGSPLTDVPPPGGIVRIGVACQQFMSNTSAEQLFFVLDRYAYFGRVGERLATVAQNNPLKDMRNESLGETLAEKVPGDTGVCLTVKNLQLSFLESSSLNNHGTPLVQFLGNDLFIKVTHRTLGGAVAISSSLLWESVQVDCTDTTPSLANENGLALTANQNGSLDRDGSQLRAVFWVHNSKTHQSNGNVKSVPLLDINIVHVIPLNMQDTECHSINISACIAGVRLGGGMNYAEALLHRFGILGPDGGPGEGLTKGLEHLSAGPLSKLFKATPLIADELKENGSLGNGKDNGILQFGTPDDVDVSIELKDWLFALEGAQEAAERWWFCNNEDSSREERCWHTTFHSIGIKAKGSPKQITNGNTRLHGKLKHPIELVTVGVEGLKILKPHIQKVPKQGDALDRVLKQTSETYAGVNLEVDIVCSEEEIDDGMAKWVVENLKFSVKQPIEAVVTKDELQYLAFLCQSEIDSMGRIAAGILRVLKLEGSIGQAAISQLSNLGSDGFERIFSPEKLTKSSSISCTGHSPSSNRRCGNRNSSLNATVVSLEESLSETQARCAALGEGLHSLETSAEQLENFKQLAQKLESMQKLLLQLRTQI
nr:UHRF1-binding protein 1-like [Ipomoea batatas]